MIKILGQLFICSLLFGVNSTQAKINDTAVDDFFFEGLHYFDLENYANAAKYFNQSLIASRHSFSPALLYIAESYLAEEMYNQAGAYFWKFIAHTKADETRKDYFLRYYQRVIDGLSECYSLNPDIAERITKNMAAHSICCDELYLDLLYSSLYKAFLRRNLSGSFRAAKVYLDEVFDKTTFDPRTIDSKLILFSVFVESGEMNRGFYFINNFLSRYTQQIVENASVPNTIVQSANSNMNELVKHYEQSYKHAANFNRRLKESSLRRYQRAVRTKKSFLQFF